MFNKIIPARPFTYSENAPAPVKRVEYAPADLVAMQPAGSKLVAEIRRINGLGRYCGLDRWA